MAHEANGEIGAMADSGLRVRRKRSCAIHLAFELLAENPLEPDRDTDQRIEIDSGLDPLAVEEVDQILGGDVARRPGSERAASDSTE